MTPDQHMATITYTLDLRIVLPPGVTDRTIDAWWWNLTDDERAGYLETNEPDVIATDIKEVSE